jgi:hypothetical protein
MKGRYHSEDLALDERIILEFILGEIGWKFVDYMHLARDINQWRAPVKLRVV